jgi:inosine/xanthosine triphosphatase
MKIIVASTNPVKIASTKQALETLFPDQSFTVQGENPGVDLPAQPLSDGETKRCAIARVIAIHTKVPDADMWVAIEGGVDSTNDEITGATQMDSSAWIVIQDKQGRWGEARTASCPIPQAVADLILSGVELGHANDQIFGMTNSKHDQGMTGIATHGLIDRTAFYVHGLIFALVPFKNPDIYFAGAV